MESAIIPEDEKKKKIEEQEVQGDAARSRIKVALTNKHFHDTVNKYIDENKPDPLVRKQMENWSFEWQQNDDSSSETNALLFQGDNDDSDDTNTNSLLYLKKKQRASHQISGTLLWKGDYMQVSLQTRCLWNGNKEGWIHFIITASASASAVEVPPVGAVNNNDDDDNNNNNSNSNSKAKIKIHERMVERLNKDDYVQKLLHNNSKKNNILCQADVRCATTTTTATNTRQQESSSLPLPCEKLEERVYTDETVAEGIRRAVWGSSSDSDAIDVFDLVLQFPFLPGTTTTTTATAPAAAAAITTTSTSNTTTTALADRAQLRLLEDATYDACEKEGEDELLQELEISHPESEQVCKRNRP